MYQSVYDLMPSNLYMHCSTIFSNQFAHKFVNRKASAGRKHGEIFQCLSFLQEPLAARGKLLEASLQLQLYLRDSGEESNWMAERLPVASSINRGEQQSLEGVKSHGFAWYFAPDM